MFYLVVMLFFGFNMVAMSQEEGERQPLLGQEIEMERIDRKDQSLVSSSHNSLVIPRASSYELSYEQEHTLYEQFLIGHKGLKQFEELDPAVQGRLTQKFKHFFTRLDRVLDAARQGDLKKAKERFRAQFLPLYFSSKGGGFRDPIQRKALKKMFNEGVLYLEHAKRTVEPLEEKNECAMCLYNATKCERTPECFGTHFVNGSIVALLGGWSGFSYYLNKPYFNRDSCLQALLNYCWLKYVVKHNFEICEMVNMNSTFVSACCGKYTVQNCTQEENNYLAHYHDENPHYIAKAFMPLMVGASLLVIFNVMLRLGYYYTRLSRQEKNVIELKPAIAHHEQRIRNIRCIAKEAEEANAEEV